MARKRGRQSNTTCAHCGGALSISVMVDAAPGSVRAMQRRLKARKQGEDKQTRRLVREQVIAEVLRRLGHRKRRVKAKPKPKRKVRMVYEEPQVDTTEVLKDGRKVTTKVKRRRDGAYVAKVSINPKTGEFNPKGKFRSCGCSARGRHKSKCHLAKANYDDVIKAKERPKVTSYHVPEDDRRAAEHEAAMRKLRNADKADTGTRRRSKLSDKGKAAIAKLDPVAKPIKS